MVFAFASYVCFLFGSEGAFFPFMYKEELLCSAYCHARKRSISLEVSFSEQILLLVGEGGVRDEAQIFLKRTKHSL